MIRLINPPQIKEMQDLPETFDNLDSLVLWIKDRYIFTTLTYPDAHKWVWKGQDRYTVIITWKADAKAMSHNTVFSYVIEN